MFVQVLACRLVVAIDSTRTVECWQGLAPVSESVGVRRHPE